MVDMDWKAAMDSEIFREYAKVELAKMAAQEHLQEIAKQQAEEEKHHLLRQFQEFERQVKSSPKKKAIFRALQQKFALDPEYAAQVKNSFVDAVMLLDLSD